MLLCTFVSVCMHVYTCDIYVWFCMFVSYLSTRQDGADVTNPHFKVM